MENKKLTSKLAYEKTLECIKGYESGDLLGGNLYGWIEQFACEFAEFMANPDTNELKFENGKWKSAHQEMPTKFVMKWYLEKVNARNIQISIKNAFDKLDK